MSEEKRVAISARERRLLEFLEEREAITLAAIEEEHGLEERLDWVAILADLMALLKEKLVATDMGKPQRWRITPKGTKATGKRRSHG